MRRIAIIALCILCSGQLIAQQHNQLQIQKLNALYTHLRNNYVDELDLEPLVDEAIRATLKELDPHSSYLTREEMISLRTRLRGEFAGVGIYYIIHNDTIVVRNTVPNSPAEDADIRPNDRITSINRQSVIGLTTDSVATLLRGKAKSKVELEVVRRTEPKTLSIKLQRDHVESSAISAAFRIDSVGYIAVSKFSKPVASEFYTAYRNLGDIKSLVVDLRNNGGGAITSAIDLTGLFLRKGDVIVSTEGRTNNVLYDKKHDGLLPDIPLVVLINENSASASEIFAGAIQDHDRGVIVGHTSYGKGLVQRVIDLKDGSGLCITIARYKTPSGRIIQRPYTMGQGEEYMRDSVRYRHIDSISNENRPQYRTLHSKRTVYGGGGITPDIYIGADIPSISRSLVDAYNGAKFTRFVIDMWDYTSFDDIRRSYPTMEEFSAEYKLDESIVTIFYEYADITTDGHTDLDRDFIKTMLMATMAEQLYDNSARYHIGSRFDNITQRAFEVAADSELMHAILRGKE